MTEPTAGALDGNTHLLPVRVYYEDTDFTGVVYHANYLRYFERGRSDFLRLAGVSHTDLLERADPSAFAVTRIDVGFKRAARVDDALTVRTEYQSVTGVRLNIGQEIRRGDEVIATAQVEAVCITPDGRVRRPPADLLERLKPLFTLK
jgi:acyl-CoA thioester hydrolase